MFDVLLDILGVEALTLRRAVLLEIIIWAVMLVAVMIDMRAGIRKAKALHIPIDSHGLRRTFTKFGDYGKVTGLFMCVDVLGLLFGLYSLPYASGAAGVIAVAIEAWSVRENLRAVRSSAARIPDIIAKMAGTQDPKEILDLLRSLDHARAAASVVVRDSVVLQIKHLPPITLSVREPWPVAVHEPADTVWQTLPVDTAAIVADYLRTRDYHFDFSSDSTGRFLVDATVGRNRLLEITPTIEPMIREVERIRTQIVTKRSRFAVTAGLGLGYTPKGFQPYIGAGVGVILWQW